MLKREQKKGGARVRGEKACSTFPERHSLLPVCESYSAPRRKRRMGPSHTLPSLCGHRGQRNLCRNNEEKKLKKQWSRFNKRLGLLSRRKRSHWRPTGPTNVCNLLPAVVGEKAFERMLIQNNMHQHIPPREQQVWIHYWNLSLQYGTALFPLGDKAAQ